MSRQKQILCQVLQSTARIPGGARARKDGLYHFQNESMEVESFLIPREWGSVPITCET
jgi:hypothetical protein